jgi:hypothetical protein
MNKKGVITIIVIIILVIVGYMVWGGSNSTVTNNPGSLTTEEPKDAVTKDSYQATDKDSTDTSLLNRLKSASVSATESGSKVALSNGKASFNAEGVKGTVVLGDIAVEKTIAGSKYAITTLAVNSGASGTFQYVVLFEDKNGNLLDNSYAFIGDRVKITGIRADEVSGVSGGTGLVVSVSYLDHDKGEPMTSTPTVPHTKILVVENGSFNAAKEITI